MTQIIHLDMISEQGVVLLKLNSEHKWEVNEVIDRTISFNGRRFKIVHWSGGARLEEY